MCQRAQGKRYGSLATPSPSSSHQASMAECHTVLRRPLSSLNIIVHTPQQSAPTRSLLALAKWEPSRASRSSRLLQRMMEIRMLPRQGRPRRWWSWGPQVWQRVAAVAAEARYCMPGDVSPVDARSQRPASRVRLAPAHQARPARASYAPLTTPGRPSTGVGKGTLISRLLASDPEKCVFSVSTTTRAPRPGEEVRQLFSKGGGEVHGQPARWQAGMRGQLAG